MLAFTVFLAVLAVPNGASAKHRAHHQPPVVASGTSQFGIPWRATVRNGAIQVSVDSRKNFRRGWVARSSLPSSVPSVFTAQLTPHVDPRPENELVGVTSSNVAMLGVRMHDGSILELYPTPAPPAAIKRFPWLAQVRVFAGFFGSGVDPTTVTAFDASNNVLAERNSNNGSF